MDMYQKRKMRQEKKSKNIEEQEIENKMNINWYPGHMAKTKRQIIEDLKLVDVVVEILDARIPNSSQNPDIQQYIKDKNRIEVLNKSDVADDKITESWKKYYESKNIPVVITEASTGKGIQSVIKTIRSVTSELQNKYAQKGRAGKNIRVLVLGIPNVGKSSFINRISKKNSAQVGNKPGVTRQKQWIKVEEGIELLDTPGVLWPKFENEKVAMNLAFTGTIKDDILQITDIAYELLKFLVVNHRAKLKERYKLDNIVDTIMNSDEYQDDNEKYIKIYEEIGRKRGAIISGGRVDYEKVGNILLDEFRSGKIGKISLEIPNIK